MPSMPQTCKESAPCVPSRSGIGLARKRCDEHHRPALSVRKSERGAVEGHGTRKCYCKELHSTISRTCQWYRPGVRWKREALLILLRERLTFVLRDGAATHAAADTPAPQRALLPRALPKQQARPPWAQTTGLEACRFEARSVQHECSRANSLRRASSLSARVSNETCAAQAQWQTRAAAHACERARCGACGLAGSFMEWSASAGCLQE